MKAPIRIISVMVIWASLCFVSFSAAIIVCSSCNKLQSFEIKELIQTNRKVTTLSLNC